MTRATGPARDRALLYAASALRAFANGLVGVLLGIYFARIGIAPATMGMIMSAGLLGALAGAVIATFRGDRFGRRRLLVVLGVLAAVALAGVALIDDPVAIAALAFCGAITGAGKDRGAMLALESAIVPATTTDAGRTKAFAWFAVTQDLAQAAGGLAAGLPVLLRAVADLGELASFRATLLVAALAAGASVPLYLAMSRATEARSGSARITLAPQSKRVLVRISALFALDSIGGGFIASALFAYFFYAQFGAGEATIAALFMAGKLISASSHLTAAWLARRIGLVNTMVFTHIPSSLILIAIAFAGDFWIAALLYLLREGLAEMDVPTRQSYVMAMVREEERTFASGITSLVRMGAWAVAPLVAGALMEGTALALPLFFAAALKILYDVLLYLAFSKLKPPEERATP